MFYSASVQLRALFELADVSPHTTSPSVWEVAPDVSDASARSLARLTIGIPGLADERLLRWLGPRIAYWPDGIVPPTWVGLASSRRARPLDEQPAWFASLRRACDEVRASGKPLLVVDDTFVARFARHAARRFAIPRVELQIADERQSLAQWLRAMCALPPRHDSTDDAPQVTRLRLSPPLEPRYVETTASQAVPWGGVVCPEIPAHDRALVGLSDHLLVLAVRPKGQLAELLAARQNEAGLPPERHFEQPTSARIEVGEAHRAAALVAPPQLPWPTLCHCTRRHDGPWAEQTEEQYLDELLFERPERDRSARAVLERIITSRRLCGSSAAIRGGYRVVGLTSVELAELSSLHVYQKHRVRWDFEPYGLCIRRDWLEQLGAQPVRYGDDALWSRLTPAERPFFQAASHTGKLPREAESGWQHEREWRVIGDIDLHSLPADAGYVFVGTDDDVRRLREISPWPVVLVAGGDHP